MDINIIPQSLCGEVRAVSSKSHAHRLLICAAFADKPTEIAISGTSDDIDATISCLRSLGAEIILSENCVNIIPAKTISNAPLLDCRESGSTLRFLLPVAAALGCGARFCGSGRLPERPIGALRDALESGGARFSADRLPLEITGKLRAGTYSIPGNISSQFITGLLLALPLLDGESVIEPENALVSGAYVDITTDVLRLFGADISRSGKNYTVRPLAGGRFRSPGKVSCDGDWSNAAFFLCAGALGKKVTVSGLSLDSTQGDKAVLSVLEKFGADVTVRGDFVTVSPAPLTGCEFDAEDIPDLVPILSVVAAYADGITRISGCARLRLKESDRMATTAKMLRALGADAREDGDALIIRGGGLSGGTVSGAGDHRIVMSAAIAASSCKSAVTVTGAEAVRKSYPSFFDDYASLGGGVNVL